MHSQAAVTLLSLLTDRSSWLDNHASELERTMLSVMKKER